MATPIQNKMKPFIDLLEENIPGKISPFCLADAITFWYSLDASEGTVDMKPIRGGSTDGCVRFPK